MTPRAPCLLLMFLPFLVCASVETAHGQQPEEIKGAPAEPADAADVRAQIAPVEKLKNVLPDRGAALSRRCQATPGRNARRVEAAEGMPGSAARLRSFRGTGVSRSERDQGIRRDDGKRA